MADNNIPNVLYHYASLEVFQKIVENKTIRLSDITKSNDSAEITWIKQFIPEVFKAAYAAEGAQYFTSRVSLDVWMRLTSFYTDYWFGEAHGNYSYYAFCLSSEEDLLSQWRGYANDGKGVAIGYDTRRLQLIIKDRILDCSLQAINYNERQQKERIRRAANDLISKIKTDIKNGRLHLATSYLEQDINETIYALRSYFEGALDEIYQFAPSMKNPFFQQEKEYRLCALLPTINKGKDEEKLFRYEARGNGFTSYIELKQPGLFEDKAHPLIRSICIGPKCNADEKEIRAIMVSNNMAGSTKVFNVRRSNGTYR